MVNNISGCSKVSRLLIFTVFIKPSKFLHLSLFGNVPVKLPPSREDKVISPTPSDSGALIVPPELVNPELKETNVSCSADYKSAEITQLDTFKKLL